MFDTQIDGGKHFVISEDVAREYGVCAAVLIGQIHYYTQLSMKNHENYHDGEYWVYNSLSEWCDDIPIFGRSSIYRAINALRNDGILIVDSFNRHKYDKTLWYRIDYGKLAERCRKDVSEE